MTALPSSGTRPGSRPTSAATSPWPSLGLRVRPVLLDRRQRLGVLDDLEDAPPLLAAQRASHLDLDHVANVAAIRLVVSFQPRCVTNVPVVDRVTLHHFNFDNDCLFHLVAGDSADPRRSIGYRHLLFSTPPPVLRRRRARQPQARARGGPSSTGRCPV